MIRAQKGFSLAELLIALALLGIIAAFTIPKILNASSNNEAVAKVRESASMLSEAFNNLKVAGNLNASLAPGATVADLYSNILPQLNYTSAGSGAPNAAATGSGSTATPAGPYNGLATAHPCASMSGWVQLANGVVISGLASTTALDTVFPGATVKSQPTYLICIDYNGSKGVNTLGTDIFVGNFHEWGAPWSGGTNVDPARPFFWGSTSAAIYDAASAGSVPSTASSTYTANKTAGSLMGT